MVTILKRGVASFAVLTAFVTAPAWADLSLHGSGTVARGIVLPHQEEIEQASELSLDVVVNGSGNGLQDLAAGRADVAMISAPVAVEAAIVNGRTPGALDTDGMQVFEIGSVEIFFVVHPTNPVQSITEDQMLDILTGEIGNWSDLGGPDAPIVVAVETPGNGTRAVVQHIFMGDLEFAAGAREVRDASHVVTIVSQLPTAVGYGNAANIGDIAVTVVDGLVIDQPLALVTSGAPSAEMERLIEAVQGLD